MTGAEFSTSDLMRPLSQAKASIRESLSVKKCSGVIGVPITFMDKYNPEQFDLIDITKAGAGNPKNKIKEYARQIQVDKNGKRSSVTKLNDGASIVIDSPSVDKTYYIVDGVKYVQTYPRILLRIKKGANK